MKPLHDKAMPVILTTAEEHDTWLDILGRFLHLQVTDTIDLSKGSRITGTGERGALRIVEGAINA